MMDRRLLPRRRQRDGAMPARPPIHLRRHRQAQSEAERQRQPSPAGAKIWIGEGHNEGHRRVDTPTTGRLQTVDDEATPRHFAVVNVGAGGVLYLKPSRMGTSNNVTHAPATPPATILDKDSFYADEPNQRASYVSGTWTPRGERGRSLAEPDPERTSLVLVPLLDPLRRTRSHSCSTRGTIYNPNDLHHLAPTTEEKRNRRRSSTDLLPQRLLDLQIPHYRLGTPRFSDRGTAYLHASIYTVSTVDGVPSSVLSKEEYENLFPVPPGHKSGVGSIYMNPSRPYTMSIASGVRRSALTSVRSSVAGPISAKLFEKLEKNLNDPAVVRHHPTNGKIVAATPTRLIAQITSPDFLDYELLADFFLTFRCFMTCQDVLEYLFARMSWAFGDGNDAGRIARVRTFVALRHWILNYFQDDFMKDDLFRQSFCDMVNELATSLRERPDRGSADINIVGELKKCWRRTCALYWPVSDALESDPDADIVPGGHPRVAPSAQSSDVSLPLTIRPTTERGSIFELTTIDLPDMYERQFGALNDNGMTPAPTQNEKPQTPSNQRDTAITNRTASIPASPLSDQSLEVLSCSVPFLRTMILRPSARSREKAEQPATPATPQSRIAKAVRPTHQHKRSGSFSDALRDKRTPLSSPKADNIELKDLPSFAIMGGLVRGILLQPSPAKVDSNIPVTPGPELNESRYPDTQGYLGERHHHIGVKKFVGEVRRALSSRKASSSTSPARTLRSAGSSTSRGNSRGSDRSQHPEPKPQPDWQQLGGPPRVDVLGAKIESSYKGAREETRLSKIVSVPNPTSSKPQRRSDLPQSFQAGKVVPRKMHESYESRDFARLNSHVTTGSRSIVIVDATGAPEIPAMPNNLPSLSSMSTEMTPIPLFRSRDDLGLGVDMGAPRETAHSMHISHYRSSDAQMHDLLSGPHRWSAIEDSAGSPASGLPRKSSSVHASTFHPFHPSALHMPALPPQLRRQPGGKDLRLEDHGQGRDPRPHSTGTISGAFSGSILISDGVSDMRLPFIDPRNERSVSLLHTHSSQPILRASFEEEARRLKGIPDEETYGGIEDALLKLEGKIPSPQFSTFSGEMVFEATEDEKKNAASVPPILKKAPSQDLPYANILLEGSTPVLEHLASPMTETQGASIFRVSGSAVPSMDSRSLYLVPNALKAKRVTASSSELSLAVPIRASLHPRYDRYSATSTPDSFSLVQEAASAVEDGSMSHYPSFRAGPWSGYGRGAFLLDDNETLSDISTEIADHHEDETGVRTFYYDDQLNGETPDTRMLQQSTTPPSTSGVDAQSPDRRQLLPRMPMRRPNQTLKEKISHPKLQEQAANQPFPIREGSESRQRGRKSSDSIESGTHMPFVLAFESEVIAEQLTVIEKDALDEVDWKDLISLNWQQSPSHARNWVDYLNKEQANGIDIVIARFNLVVKWCVSEIVLTDLPSERARTITKYIHIASHCHRLHNFASLYQITLALLSSDLARLTKTWSLVALREKQMLEQLEQLCRPLRNFHNLRAEMETAMPGNGIIPFIGLYTHDLMFNALKSARINSPTPGKQPLINFERYQTAANIVKNLLRLTEASSRYTFRPEPEALSRCLWIAALEDADIEARSIALEKSA